MEEYSTTPWSESTTRLWIGSDRKCPAWTAIPNGRLTRWLHPLQHQLAEQGTRQAQPALAEAHV